MSNERLDVLDSLIEYFKFDRNALPETITFAELQQWEAACTNPKGFRQTRPKATINKNLPEDARGVRKTVLRFPQWMRERTVSRGVYQFRSWLVTEEVTK